MPSSVARWTGNRRASSWNGFWGGSATGVLAVPRRDGSGAGFPSAGDGAVGGTGGTAHPAVPGDGRVRDLRASNSGLPFVRVYTRADKRDQHLGLRCLAAWMGVTSRAHTGIGMMPRR